MKLRFASLFLAATSATSFATTPTLMSYQGRVSDASGVLIGAASPVNRTITFKFYSTSTGGVPLYAEAQTVTISAGEFSVLIGNGTGVATFKGPGAPATTPYITLPSIMNGNVYLGVTVDDGTPAADPEITPRQQIVSAAYSFRAGIADSVVDGALSTNMLADTSVTTNKIGSNQVTTVKIADSNITTAKIADSNITTTKIADLNITGAKIAANAITSDKIADGTITNADIGNNQINSAKIADGSVTSADIADGGIATVDLADSAVSTNKVAANAIDYNKLAAAVQQSLCPPGTIIAYGGETAPTGWLLCNGSAVDRSAYPNLFTAISTRFGSGNNSTTFNVPDFRGRFLRGKDGGTGRDPDRASRTAMNAGGAVGDAVGSIQGDDFRSHAHNYQDIYFSESGGSVVVPDKRGSGDSDKDNGGFEITRTSAATGGHETRPLNANVNYIIKF
jgi:hypothetical protein